MGMSYNEGLEGWLKNAGMGYSDDNGYHDFTPQYFYGLNDPSNSGGEVGPAPGAMAEYQAKLAQANAGGNSFDENSFLNYIRGTRGIDSNLSNNQIRDYYTANGFPDMPKTGGILSSLFGVTGVNLSNMIRQFKDNPSQVFVGGQTPLAAKIINGALGTNYKPVISDTGGPTDENVQQAQAKGYDTEFPEMMRFFADSIAKGFGGAAAAGALGAGSGSSSAGSMPSGFGDAGYSFAGQGSGLGTTIQGYNGQSTLSGDAGTDTLGGEPTGWQYQEPTQNYSQVPGTGNYESGVFNSPQNYSTVDLNSIGTANAGLGQSTDQTNQPNQSTSTAEGTQSLNTTPTNDGGAMDQFGSRSFPDNGTNETIFNGNAAESPGGTTSVYDQIRQYLNSDNLSTAQNVMSLGGGLLGLLNANKQKNALSSLDSGTPANYRQYDDLVNQYLRDPMSLLRNNAGYNASVDFLTKEGNRKMAATGMNDSGNRSYYLADTLGKNANSWINNAWQPIRDAAGLANYPNTAALDQVKLNAQDQILRSRNQAMGSLFKAGADMLPTIFKYMGQ